MSALIVIAKAPVPGRVKTRLCPPCAPEEAAALAGAAIADTLDAARASAASRVVLCLDGDPALLAADLGGLEVIAQRPGGLDRRLAGAFADAGGGPALLIGMDTPQVGPSLLDTGLAALDRGLPAVIGGAPDGGFWAVGLRDPDPVLFHGVPMSTAGTGAEQRARLHAHGRPPVELRALRDVDTFADARAVAALAPQTRFAAALCALAVAA